jgi:phage N-6-adenine-methyltransferase
MNTDLHFSTGKDDWGTPLDLFDAYNKRFGFVLDAAADQHNHLVERWFGPGGEHEDALTVDWELDRGPAWLNPPYSRGLQYKFVEKAINEVKRYGSAGFGVVMLLPARTDTRLFHHLLYDVLTEKWRFPVRSVTFLKGRLKFRGAKHGAPFPSMIVVVA